jgi:hypothetical protein
MRLTFTITCSLVALGSAIACSSDDTGSATQNSTATGGKSGGTGGSTGSGTGGASTGGKDPKDCPADSGTESCRQCLAANCCDAYSNCVRDDACSQALETYRQCANAAVSGSDKGRCFATFSQAMKDAGASASLGQAIGVCVYRSCISCGASSI